MRRYLKSEATYPQGSNSPNLKPLFNVLRQVDLFHGISHSHLLEVMALCSEKVCELGESILEENTPGTELYVILEGSVEILLSPSPGHRQSAGSDPMVIATLWPGQVFGEIGLVDAGMRSASARAASKGTRLQSIQRDRLLAMCEQDHDFGYQLMRNIAGNLALKIRSTDITLRDRIFWEGVPSTDCAK
jgi:CRP/FNR family transcriptional regulator, cyclic AMP receptor protein